ncbi:hypothetical protein VNI00_009704 [Paramarasmius palmivorus]|uniref:Aminotransferase class I/classII large domain-containing protein n=1 Tax=Paramarasmius palmivorus TaxID=297713 RepID=A0AAW0CNG0_9AGAR
MNRTSEPRPQPNGGTLAPHSPGDENGAVLVEPRQAPTPLVNALGKALESRVKRNMLYFLPPPQTSETIDFTLNDYLSLSASQHLHEYLLATLNKSPKILGAGASRLIVNPQTHASLESRLCTFFHQPTGGTLLFNSGFEANVSFFATIPQPGDVVVYDEYIHASVHDGLKSGCRAEKVIKFKHNDVNDLKSVLESFLATETETKLAERLRNGVSSVILGVESLYSMDGTLAPLASMVRVLEEVFPLGNASMFVDEAHATGVYGPQGRGRVAFEGLEGHPRILARLCTFGKALAASGAVLLTEPLVVKYLVNYARPLIFTTTLSNLSIIAASCSFDMLEDGTASGLAEQLLDSCKWFVETLRKRLKENGVTKQILIVGVLAKDGDDPSSFSPIIPLLTPSDPSSAYSPAVDLSSHLLDKYRIVARPFGFPVVPKGQERVRVCMNAGHGREQVEKLLEAVLEWAIAAKDSRQ